MEKRVSLKFNINIDMMKSFFLKKVVFIFLLMISFSAFSQHRPVIKNARKVSQPKNIRSHNPCRVGGGVGFSMGSHDYLGLSIGPFVGYEVVRNLELGVSTGYQFTKNRNVKQHLFNVGPYTNFYPIPEFFARLQYEYFRGSSKRKSTGESYNFDENALWIGAGYRNTGPVQVYFGLMYNLLYSGSSHVFTNGFRPIAGVSFHL